MTEYLLIVLVTFVIIYALIKGCHIDININVNQSFSAEDRQLLEDLFNEKGEPKEMGDEVSVDEIIKSLNNLMLGNEE